MRAVRLTLVAAALAAAPLEAQACMASWYGAESGTHTATGERFNPEGNTAAHPWFPLNTIVRVSVPGTGRSIVLRINDRGPARWTGRCIDLAHGAARRLGINGVAEVSIEPISIGEQTRVYDDHYFRRAHRQGGHRRFFAHGAHQPRHPHRHGAFVHAGFRRRR